MHENEDEIVSDFFEDDQLEEESFSSTFDKSKHYYSYKNSLFSYH